MRLLCVSDVHYNLPQMDWTLDRAGQVDVVVLAGDLLDVAGRSPVEAQILVVSKYLTRMSRSAVVLASSGNHDLDGPGPDGEQRASWLPAVDAPLLYVDGHSVDLEDIRFTVCPWWDGPRTKQIVAEQLHDAAMDCPAHWVWVYHSPPAGSRLCTNGRREYPDPDLTAWIDQWQPNMVFCGHIHQAPWVVGGSWVDKQGPTWVFNAGHQAGHEPPHILVDFGAQTAMWIGSPAQEIVDLSDSDGVVRPATWTPLDQMPLDQ
jgi:Icc-related predicted phosphoesterase